MLKYHPKIKIKYNKKKHAAYNNLLNKHIPL